MNDHIKNRYYHIPKRKSNEDGNNKYIYSPIPPNQFYFESLTKIIVQQTKRIIIDLFPFTIIIAHKLNSTLLMYTTSILYMLIEAYYMLMMPSSLICHSLSFYFTLTTLMWIIFLDNRNFFLHLMRSMGIIRRCVHTHECNFSRVSTISIHPLLHSDLNKKKKSRVYTTPFFLKT